MFTNLLFLFTVVPAVELLLLIKVGQYIGAVNTLLLIIVTGVTGASLARLQGFLILERIQETLNRGEMPTEEMLDGLMVFAGGVLLLTPGLITDCVGILLLIPLTRDLIKVYFKKRWLSALERGENITIYSSRHHRSRFDRDDVDDADFH